MIILVSDTSILIDLERGGLLEAAFSCGFTLVVPDLLYQRELEDTNGPYLRSLGLGVVELSPSEVTTAQTIKMERQTLSLPDCFALCCAMRPSHMLVSGDKALRSEATARLGNVYGLLWLLDEIAASNMATMSQLHDGLSRIAAHQRCRLPKEEINRRLRNWAAPTHLTGINKQFRYART